MSTRPWLKFYPSDWLGSSRLRRCSFEARGLAIDLISLMHSGEPYGHLTVKSFAALARTVGAERQEVARLLPQLLENGVFVFRPAVTKSCTNPDEILRENGVRFRHARLPKTGTIFSPRMVRDYEKHLKRQADGGKGGNPALTEVVNHQPATEVKPSDTRDQRPESKKDIYTQRGLVVVELEKQKRKSGKAKTIPLPDDWRPNATAIALANSLNVDLADCEARFRDYLASSGKLYADYDAAFRTFIRNTPKFKGPKSHAQATERSVVAAQDRLNAKIDEFNRPAPSLTGPGSIRGPEGTPSLRLIQKG